jgi:hypothetical protein
MDALSAMRADGTLETVMEKHYNEFIVRGFLSSFFSPSGIRFLPLLLSDLFGSDAPICACLIAGGYRSSSDQR